MTGTPAARVVAIVLAAGAGSRFGAPKQLAEVGGQPMVTRAVEAALGVAEIDDVVVVLGAHRDKVAGALPDRGEQVVECEVWADGIGASLACGLRAACEVDAAIVLLGDLPLVDSGLAAFVLHAGLVAVTSGDYDAARPICPDGIPGHPVLLGAEACARAATLTGDRGVMSLLDPARVLTLECDGPASVFDVDEPADLVVARALAVELGAAGRAATGGARPEVAVERVVA